MPKTHTIRLRGPWQIEPIARSVRLGDGSIGETTDGLPPPGRATMPGDWSDTLGKDFRGRAMVRRRFGQPTSLGPDETVWLVVEAADLFGTIHLNETPLGQVHLADGPVRFDVTPLLSERNELCVYVELPLLEPADERTMRPGRQGQPGGLIGEVRLEIEAA